MLFHNRENRIMRPMYFTLMYVVIAVKCFANDVSIPMSFEGINKVIVVKTDSTTESVNISPHIERYENIYNINRYEKYSISPDGKIIPLYLEQLQKRKGVLLIIDRDDASIKRNVLFSGFRFNPDNISWLSDNTILLSSDLSSGSHILFDVKTEKTKILLGEESFPKWDNNDNNYVSIYGKCSYFQGRNIPEFNGDYITTGGAVMSEVIRYNSYCVYPKSVRSFRNKDEYYQWRKYCHYGPNVEIPVDKTKLYDSGVYDDCLHYYSRPVFISKSTWAGVYEIIFENGNTSDMIEMNAMMIDAHEVDSDPPSESKILIKKKKIQLQLTHLTDAQWGDLIMNLEARWNDKEKRLELWKRIGWKTDFNPPQELGYIDVNIDDMLFGSYIKVLPDSGITWSFGLSTIIHGENNTK
jgi:hypothetical protein